MAGSRLVVAISKAIYGGWEVITRGTSSRGRRRRGLRECESVCGRAWPARGCRSDGIDTWALAGGGGEDECGRDREAACAGQVVCARDCDAPCGLRACVRFSSAAGCGGRAGGAAV